MTVAFALVTGVGFSAPAAASFVPDDVVLAEHALDDLGLLASQRMGRSDQAPTPSGSLDAERGLVVRDGAGEVAFRPHSDHEGVLSPSGRALVYSESRSHSVALTGTATAADAGYVVINDASAPDSYAFEFEANGHPAILELVGGRVLVKDAAGDVVTMLSPAWAVDAYGRQLRTSYSVNGDVLTQRVEHRGAAYPVVADPRVACSGLFCTLELTKRETAQLADNALNAGVVCGVTGPAVVLCTAAVIGGWAQANIARNTGQCFGTLWASYPLPNNFHNVYLRCYA
ncbi:hypothetical protein [Leifsonia sp. Le1]|uniref:hypothetical protein n=1 Tax=Leifsonia sp. Le1 TaxID=3404918 RepID=UPI003EC13B8D